jgi:hypothetical protein
MMSLSSPIRSTVCAAAVVAVALLGVGVPAAAAAPVASVEPAAGPFAGFTDKSALREAGRAVVSSGRLPVADGSAPAAVGTTYYIDSVGGDDAAAGTSAAEAWQTLDKVNALELAAGDRVLLKAGSVWSAEGDTVAREAYDYTTWSGGAGSDVVGADATALLAPGGSGTAEHPIVLSSYGDGDAPELRGRGVVNDVVQLTNQEHWDISNLEISNATDGFDASAFQPARSVGQAPGDENPDTGDLRGIHVQAENAGTLRGYDIHGVYIRDVSGYTWSVSSAGLDRSKRTGGILFEGLKGDARTVSQFEDISVRDNYVANTAFANLVFKQFAGMGTNRYQNLPPGWGDRATAGAAPDGTLTEDANWRPHTNVEITGNYLTNRETEYGWDSMYLTSVRAATVAGNVIDGAGVSGIEMYYADNIVVQDNEVAQVEGRTGAADSNGIDPDRGTSNILIQGNDIHESGEGILLCGFGFSTAVVRYNVIRDIERNYVNPHGDSGVNVVYNNLMYNTVAPIRNNTIGFFESSGSAAQYLNARNPHHIYNNVFVNTREDVAGSAFRSEFPGVSFSNNSYFGPTVIAPSQDAHATVTDPLLSGDPAADIRNAAIGSASSPLIGAGRPVDLAEIAPGFAVTGDGDESRIPLGVDFFGAPLSSPPSVGVASYRPGDGQGLVSGFVSDADGVPVAGATVSHRSGTTTADARGRYVFEAPAGDYTLTPAAEGYLDGEGVAVSIGDGQTVRADLTLGETTTTVGSIAGTTTSSGSPLAGATVTVSKGGATIATTTTDAAGTFSIGEIEKGDGYVVTGVKHGYQTETRSDVTVTAARTATVDLVLRREVGETVYAIDETFDDETAGDFTQTSDGALIARTAPSVGTISVIEDPQRAGNRYLRINKSSASSATLGVHNAAELDLTGTVTVEARLQRTTTNGTPNQLALYSYTESGWNATNPASSTNPSATIGFAGGKIITHNVTGASTVRQVADYAVGQWYTVRNVVDLDAGTFDFYIDDMANPVLTDQPLRTKVDDLDYFLFFINGSTVGDLLVDYLRVNTGTPYDRADASLASVTATAGDDEVALNASADGSTYAGEAPPYAHQVTITPESGSGFATLTVGGTEVGSGESVDVALTDGAPNDPVFVTEIPVVVTAEDGTRRAYVVAISRINPNQLTSLRDLSIDGSVLSPEFDPGRSGTENPYVVAEPVAADVTSATVRWAPGWDGQQVQVNGEDVPTGASEATVDLVPGQNTVQVTANSFAGDFATYVVTLTRDEADTVRPRATLVSPSTSGPFAALSVRVDASDDQGLKRIVANIYRDGTLVRSTQSAVDGAREGSHLATVSLPSGDYTVRYNAQDLAGNISRTSTFSFTIDATAPTVTVKDGASFTVGADGAYGRVSFKLFDAGKIDKVVINGKTKDLADNTWSDVNFVAPGVFGAVPGANTMAVHDVAGNVTVVAFTLR